MSQQVILNEDIFSNFNISDKDRIPYGKRNEVVTVVGERVVEVYSKGEVCEFCLKNKFFIVNI